MSETPSAGDMSGKSPKQRESGTQPTSSFCPPAILETRTFNEAAPRGKPESVSIADWCRDLLLSVRPRSKEPYVRQTAWDLVVVDEAHRLRNVYKPTNKISQAIKQAIFPFQKALLTATPLQNSLLELYGLVSIIDDFTFGDLKSFRAQFARLTGDADFAELKQRLQPICKRTLRKQVLEYIKYTNRHALVQEFIPSADEQRLYNLVSDYLQKGHALCSPRKPTSAHDTDSAEIAGILHLCDLRHARRVGQPAATRGECGGACTGAERRARRTISSNSLK